MDLRPRPVTVRAVRRLLKPLGVSVTELEKGTVLAQWGDEQRVARQVGPAPLRTHLVVHPPTVRERMNGYQNQLGAHLGEEHLAWVLRRMKVDCVLDVGANVGQFATRLRRSGYRGRIVSFEPVAALAAQLEAKAAGDPDWHVHACALGEEEGTAEIHTRPGTMSSLLPSSEFGKDWNDRLEQDRVETIQVRRLDHVLDDAIAGMSSPTIFLKLDTQGFDLPALRGAGDRVRDLVGLQSELACVPIYEGMPRMPEQLVAYEEAGFEVSGIFPVTRHKRTLRAIEFDVVMVRPEAVGPA